MPESGEVEPASKEGAFGSWASEPAQAPPPGAVEIAQVSEGAAGGPDWGADHGVSSEVVE